MRRRTFLQTSAGTLAGAGILGMAGTTIAATKPAVEWEAAHDSNYTDANRSADDVRWVVLHTIEGSADSAMYWFQDPDANVSAHFVVDETGGITQMVSIEDVAWTQGNWGYNQAGISVELAGYAGETEFSEAMYESVGRLVAYLCGAYEVPIGHPTFDVAPCSPSDGEGGIVGHDQIPSPNDCSKVVGGAEDPGPTWNWPSFVAAVERAAGGGPISIGDAVETTGTVTVRVDLETGEGRTRTLSEGVRGVVRAGPRSRNDRDWWHVDFENGVTGWGVEDDLAHADVSFLHGQRVETTANLVIHDDHYLRADRVWVAPVGSTGYVRAGPVVANEYRWWRVAFEVGVEGWGVEEYLGSAPLVIEADEDATFEVGQAVRPTTYLNVRSDGSLAARDVGTVSPSDEGRVLAGFVASDGYTWWAVDWGDGLRGWSVERYLEEASTPDGVVPDGFDVDTELTRSVAVTGEDVDEAIRAEVPDSPMVGLGDTFVAVQDDLNVDALYQAAHAIHESAWGTSRIARDKHNLYGWGAVDADPYDGAVRFESFEHCVRYVMEKVKGLYLTPGDWRFNGPTLDGMNVYYASDDRWAEEIAAHYRTLVENVDFSR